MIIPELLLSERQNYSMQTQQVARLLTQKAGMNERTLSKGKGTKTRTQDDTPPPHPKLIAAKNKQKVRAERVPSRSKQVRSAEKEKRSKQHNQEV